MPKIFSLLTIEANFSLYVVLPRTTFGLSGSKNKNVENKN